MNCRIAQASMYSGTSKAHMNRKTVSSTRRTILRAHRDQKRMFLVSTGSGIFGWIDTHVQRKIVVKQPHTMLDSVLQSSIFLQEFGVATSFTAGAGSALAEKTWTSKRRSIPSCTKGEIWEPRIYSRWCGAFSTWEWSRVNQPGLLLKTPNSI